MIEVTQADREAAASGYYAWCSGNPVIPQKMLSGRADDHSIVQAFARHRTEAEARAKIEGVKLGIEAAARIAYRVCSETRHVSLGEAAYDSIRALDPATIAGADHDAT